MPARDLHLAQDPAADALLSRDGFALLVGMLLDQQIPMEWAFHGPAAIAERLGHPPTPAEVAAMDPAALGEVFARKPAVHRYPGSMATRVQALAVHLVREYDGQADRVWLDVPDGATLLRRLTALPGYGTTKAQIFTALLGKQCGVTPPGWREAAGGYGVDGSTRSIADVTGPELLAAVRAYKQQAKAAAKAGRAPVRSVTAGSATAGSPQG